MKNVKIAKWTSLILGILLIVCGVLYLGSPVEGTIIIVRILAAVVLLMGILRIIRYVSSDYFHSAGFLISGILDVLLGILMFRNVTASYLAFSFFIGFWVLFSGIIETVTAFDFRRLRFPNWWLGLISGIVGIILGFLLITNVNLSTFYVSVMVAVDMFILAINLIATFFVLSKFEKEPKF